MIETGESVQLLQISYKNTSCACGDTICPTRCMPDAAAQLQPIPYACGAQRAFIIIIIERVLLKCR